MEFQVVTFESEDVSTDEDPAFEIHLFGRARDGRSVFCAVPFRPYFFVKCAHPKQSVANFLVRLDEKLPHWLMRRIEVRGLISRQDFLGFSGGAFDRFAVLMFPNRRMFACARKYLREAGFSLYEANLDPVLRFIHLTDIESAGWIRVRDFVQTDDPCDKLTRCDVEIRVPSYRSVSPVPDDPSIARIMIASYDIETYSPDGSFPDPTNPQCEVFQVAVSFEVFGADSDEATSSHLLTLKKCAPLENDHDHDHKKVDVRCFVSERALLRAWIDLIQQRDPDVLLAYNNWKFDDSYLYRRADIHNISPEYNLSRMVVRRSELYAAKFSSGAFGDNEYSMVTTYGRLQLDLLELVKREHKLVKYSLNFVAEHFLKDKKVDMPIHEMFRRYRRGTPEDIRDIGKYCVKDTLLPLKLLARLSQVPNLVEMARVTYVPLNFLLQRGQQIKVFSQICRATRLAKMLVPTIDTGKESGSFVGATVLDAQKGAYMDRVITCLDFASLYPTIMRAHNLCYTTIVLNPRLQTDDALRARFPNTEFRRVELSDDKVCFFAQSPPGILPKLLEQLALSRKQAKKDMATTADPAMKQVFNGKQLAFKVSMNSIYGFCGAFMLPCQAISASVTTIGREMIAHTKALVEEYYPGSEVVYGYVRLRFRSLRSHFVRFVRFVHFVFHFRLLLSALT